MRRRELLVRGAMAALMAALLASTTALASPITPGRLSVDWHASISPSRFLEYAPLEKSLPAVDPARGWLFVADRFGTVRSFDISSRLRWEVEVGGAIEAGLVFDEGRLYVATVRGRVICLDAVTGEELWTYSSRSELATTPTVAGGRLFVSSMTDTLLVLDAETGEFLWFHRRPRPDGLTIRGAAPAVVGNGRVVTGFSDGGVVALDVEDGRLLWRTEVGAGEHRDVNAAPVVHDGRVYVVSHAGSLHALDLATGLERWNERAPRGATRMVRAHDRLVIGAPGVMSAHRLVDGALLWETKLNETGLPSEITVSRGRVCVGTEEGPLLVLSAKTGRPELAFDPGTGVGAGALPDARGLWLLSNGGRLYRLSWPN